MDNASIKDENSKGFASFAFPEAKSSKTGVSVRYVPSIEREWYVLRIKYGQAQAVADAIIEDGTYVYLAKVWKDIRNKETGKTSCLLALRDYLNQHGDYIAVYANVEGGQASRNNVQSVVKSTVDTLAEQVRLVTRDGAAKAVRDSIQDEDPIQRFVLELKIKRGSLDTVIQDGLRQTFEYMDSVGSVDEGHLIIFDRSKDKTWEERIWHKPCQYQGKTIQVWGM